MKKMLLFSLLALFVAFPCYAASGTVSAKNPEAILEIAKGFGSATLEKDNTGDPKIVGRIDGVKYGIFFFGCTDNKDCTSIQFATGWTGYQVTRDQLNEWNMKKRFGKAYMDDENDPRMEMDVLLRHPVSTEAVEQWFTMWQLALREFGAIVLNP